LELDPKLKYKAKGAKPDTNGFIYLKAEWKGEGS